MNMDDFLKKKIGERIDFDELLKMSSEKSTFSSKNFNFTQGAECLKLGQLHPLNQNIFNETFGDREACSVSYQGASLYFTIV